MKFLNLKLCRKLAIPCEPLLVTSKHNERSHILNHDVFKCFLCSSGLGLKEKRKRQILISFCHAEGAFHSPALNLAGYIFNLIKFTAFVSN